MIVFFFIFFFIYTIMGNNRKPSSSGGRKRNGKKRYNQGFYQIINTNKFMGDPNKCIYRSGWELKFMMFLDRNDKILRWGSENITIPYYTEDRSNGVLKSHRYYPDFYYELMINNDPHYFQRVVVEVKPFKETQPPKPPTKETVKALETYEYQLKTFQKNMLKWESAVKWCNANKMKFVIIHEGHLKKNNIM